jgi:hypothetical protein
MLHDNSVSKSFFRQKVCPWRFVAYKILSFNCNSSTCALQHVTMPTIHVEFQMYVAIKLSSIGWLFGFVGYNYLLLLLLVTFYILYYNSYSVGWVDWLWVLYIWISLFDLVLLIEVDLSRSRFLVYLKGLLWLNLQMYYDSEAWKSDLEHKHD